jgi:hypothetical protein
MNTIPTIFNGTVTPYTVIGGKEHFASSGISAVILSRYSHFPRRLSFQELEKTGFDNVISIESSSPNYDIEELSKRYPFVRFIIPERDMNLGEQINLAASEIESPLFFVLRGDSKIIAGGTAKKMAERLISNNDSNANNQMDSKRLCTVPVIMNSRYEVLRTLVSPVTQKRKMKTILMEPHTDGDLTLYPFDGVGIYNRLRFIQTGGFDITLKNTHWQLMDFGFRSHLWGEEIAFCLQLKISYDDEQITEYLTTESSYLRFYLKNLAPVFQSDHAYLPIRRFPNFFFKSGEDPFTAWEEFSGSKNWVKTNQFRWKCGARDVIARLEDLAKEKAG